MPWYPANPMAGALGASPGIGALLAGASTLTVVAACAGQPPGHVGIHARRHAGHPRARRPPVIPGSELLGNCRGWSSPAKARGCDPHLPDLAGSDMETRGCETCPRNALTISFAPSAEALCDALVVNGRRLPAIMRPAGRPRRAGNCRGSRGCIGVMIGSPAR